MTKPNAQERTGVYPDELPGPSPWLKREKQMDEKKAFRRMKLIFAIVFIALMGIGFWLIWQPLAFIWLGIVFAGLAFAAHELEKEAPDDQTGD